MRRALVLFALFVLVAVAPPATDALGATTTEPYVVVLQDSVSDPSAVAKEFAGSLGLQVTYVYAAGLKGFAASIPTGSVGAVSGDSRVKFLSPDRPMTSTAQTLPTGINRIDGDLGSTLSGNGSGSVNVPIAIIDSGSTHTDLNVAGGKGCVAGSTSYADANGHGTHVAGTAAAKDDGTGVVGVAPGAPVWSVRVLNSSGVGTTASLVCGVDWVTANAQSLGIKVANMSIAGTGSDDANCGNTNNDALHQAICRSVAAGVTYVVGAGNAGVNFSSTVPAAYDEVLTVTDIADFNGKPGGGAAKTCQTEVDETADDKSNFTTIGSADSSHTIAAPGVCIYSTYKSNKYANMSGTSMAAPHGAGAVAFCIASGACAGLSPAQIIQKLRTDAATQPSTYSFIDGPNSPNGTRYYGDLLYAGGY
jgi:subtilisin family serine protease